MKRLFSLLLATCLLLTTFSLPASAATTFNDVPQNAWYTAAVEYCAANGYVSGIGNGKFDPNGKVSRAQMAQILYNFAGCPDVSNVSNPFNDVPNNAWYTKAVKFAKSTGIVNGTSATTYSPNAYITREQVAVMLLGYYKSSGKTVSIDLSVLDKFTDSNKISSWATNAIAWAVENKIMSGIGNGKLDPKGTCTRAQLAQFIKNYWGIKDNEPGEVNPPVVEPDIDPIVKALIGDTQPLDKDWLPVGGYTQGGRKYNMYGIDITDVDGIPNREEARLVNMINDYRVANGLPALKWSQHAQVMSEVRAHETAYLYEHARPDGTTLFTNDHLMMDELKTTASMIDAEMVAAGKTANLNKAYAFCENLMGALNNPNTTAEYAFNAWKNSPGHNNTMLDSMTDLGDHGYIAVSMGGDKPNCMTNSWIYTAYAVDWGYTTSSGTVVPEMPKYDPKPGEDWYPGQGLNYDVIGFTLNDIPYEYPDWILRDPEMDIDDYGATDHDVNSLEAWLVDNGVDEYSDLMYQVKAHFFSTLDMDDYIKFMCCKSYPYHYARMLPGEWSDITEMDTSDIRDLKDTLVEAVADKLSVNHPMEIVHSESICETCKANHASTRDLSAAETIVNQFFADTYGFDISAY